MNRIYYFLRCFFALLGLWWGLQSTLCQAISYTMTVDTTPLASQTTPPAPFSLEFQFIDGGGTANNIVTLSNFDFGAGGSPSGSPTTSGGASGDLSGTVMLTDSDFFNEFIQGFTPSGSDPLRFLLNLTTNVEAVTPDAFSFAIFDSSGTEIPTSYFGAFAQIDITDPLTISTYTSDTSVSPPGCPTCPPITIDAPTVEAVPEPSTFFLFGTALLGVVVMRKWVVYQFSRCPMLDRQAELKAVDEQPNDNIMHVDGSRKADGLSH